MTISLLTRLSDNHLSSEENDYHWISPPNEVLLSELKMLLMSRVRLSDIEDIPLVNASVLNYGIDESFSHVNEVNARCQVIEHRLRKAIARFEPRLSQLTLTSHINDAQAYCFILRGVYSATPIVLELMWNDCTGRFYFNE